MVLDYHAPGRHLLLDGVVTIVYKNTRHRETGEIPGYAAKLVKDKKFYADKTSKRPVARIHGGMHTLISFAVEDGGRLGAHAHAFLRSLANRVVRQGRRSRSQLVTPKETSSVVMGPPRNPYGFRGGSAPSPLGFISPCPCNFLGSYALNTQQRTSSPRESV